MLLSETKNKFPFPPCKTIYSHKEEIGGVTSYGKHNRLSLKFEGVKRNVFRVRYITLPTLDSIFL